MQRALGGWSLSCPIGGNEMVVAGDTNDALEVFERTGWEPSFRNRD